MRRLHFEQLESRCLMATDVAWSIVAGNVGHVVESDGQNTYVSTVVPYGDEVAKYDENGNRFWAWHTGGNVSRMYLDGGHLYVCYSDHLAKLTLDGQVVWKEALAVGIVSNGWVTVFDGDAGGVSRLNDLDNVVWLDMGERTIGGFLATDDALYLSRMADAGAYVAKLDFQGNEQWSYAVGDNDCWANISELTAAPDGLYFRLTAMGEINVGGIDYTIGRNDQTTIIGRLNSDGQLLWHRTNGHGTYNLHVVGGALFMQSWDGAVTNLFSLTPDGETVAGLGHSDHEQARLKVIKADASGFDVAWYVGTYLSRVQVSLDDPGLIPISTMGFSDPPAVASFSPADVPTFSNSIDPAIYSALAEYWAEQGDNELPGKKRRAA